MVSSVCYCARLIRFDRSGAVVSEEFDYVAHPEVIGTFLFQLSSTGRADRGHDPMLSLASETEATTFRELHNCFHVDSASARGLRSAVAEGWPIVKITMDALRLLSSNSPPHFDSDLLGDESPEKLEGQQIRSLNIALSLFQSHDWTAGACTKAIWKVWPALDKRDCSIRPAPGWQREYKPSRRPAGSPREESRMSATRVERGRRAWKVSGGMVPQRWIQDDNVRVSRYSSR